MTAQGLNLQEILKKKWDSDQLAHFYILQSKDHPLAEKEMTEWTIELLNNFLGNQGYSNFQSNSHPDILWIELGDERAYSHNDERFEEIFKMNDFRPMQLKKKIIVLEKCYLISNTLANKLLKTLEDASEHILFLFMNPGQKKLLDTIRSRALTLTLGAGEENNSWKIEKGLPFSEWIKKYQQMLKTTDEQVSSIENMGKVLSEYNERKINLINCIDQIREDKSAEDATFKILHEWMNYSADTYQKSLNYQNALAWWEEQKIYHNSSASRLENLINLTL